MNKSFFYLLLASVVGYLPLQAKDIPCEATVVQASLNHTPITGKAKFEAVAMKDAGGVTFTKDSRMELSSLKDFKGKDGRWFVLHIPMAVAGACRVKPNEVRPATCIKELTVKVYLLYKAPVVKGSKDDDDTPGMNDAMREARKYRLIEKEITYVDIPLNKIKKQSGKKKVEVGYAEMSVALFVPITTSSLMIGDEDASKITSNNSLIAAYAIEPIFNGRPCKKVEVSGESGVSYSDSKLEFTHFFDSRLETLLGSAKTKWWKQSEGKSTSTKDHFPAAEVQVYSIAETPFAPYYSNFYPATKPMYGPAPMEPEKSAGEEGSSTVPPIPGAGSDIPVPGSTGIPVPGRRSSTPEADDTISD